MRIFKWTKEKKQIFEYIKAASKHGCWTSDIYRKFGSQTAHNALRSLANAGYIELDKTHVRGGWRNGDGRYIVSTRVQ